MTNIPSPPDKKSQQPNDTDESLVVNPINMARARHASAHSRTVVDKARPKPISSEPQQHPSKPAVAVTTASKAGGIQLDRATGCLLIVTLGVALLVGGVLGGLISGGVLLWANDSEAVVLWSETPTLTPPPTLTPVPVATMTPIPTPQPSPTPSTEDIIAEVIPSVVTVINQQRNTFIFGAEDGRVVGSGVIVDDRGYIATNYHVIENADELRVILTDGREVAANLVASEPAEDLAVVKVDVEGLPAIQWGDSSTARPGQTVYAIGSPLGDFPNSVSFGIISGLNRALEMDEQVIDGLLQTDTAINRGSSGGPLVNVHGKMIGINTFIIRESEDRGVAEGIAFAIPANTAKNLLIPWIAAHNGETVPIPASEEPGN